MIHGNAGGVEDFEFGVVELLSREYRAVECRNKNTYGGGPKPLARKIDAGPAYVETSSG